MRRIHLKSISHILRRNAYMICRLSTRCPQQAAAGFARLRAAHESRVEVLLHVDFQHPAGLRWCRSEISVGEEGDTVGPQLQKLMRSAGNTRCTMFTRNICREAVHSQHPLSLCTCPI